MKIYIKPEIDIIKIQTTQLIAASGDIQNFGLSDETIDDTYFSAPEAEIPFSDDFDEI